MATFSPCLGSRASVAACSTFQFLAVGDAASSGNGGSLEVWTDLSGTWQEHQFREHSTPFGNVLIAQVPVTGEGTYQFTYRIRDSAGGIAWLSKAAGNDNGAISVASTASADAFDPTANADQATEVLDEQSQSNVSTRIIKYSLTDGVEGQVESFRIITLGGWSSGLSIERSKPTWFTARPLDRFNGLSTTFDCQLLLYQSGNQVISCFPLSLPNASSTLRGCREGSDSVWLRSERESSSPAQAQCVVSWGTDYDLLGVIDACTEAAKRTIDEGAGQRTNRRPQVIDEVAEPKWSLAQASKAIYCTWNSLGQDYTYSGVVQRLETLRADGNLGYFESLLLDDGWQDVARSPENNNLRGLRSFGLREGWLDENISTLDGESKLAAVVRTLKDRFPEIRSIGVWMTLQGYWNGLHPDSDISKAYELTRYGVRDNQAQYPYPPPFEHIYLPATHEIERYWSDYLRTLNAAGVDFVKIDNQAALDYLVGDGAATMRQNTSRTARAIASEVFGSGNLINCMAGSPRYYNAFLSAESDPNASLRTSDDFFPNEPDSHRFHIALNATTALLDRKLVVTRDFDMFTTHHDMAEYHALLRCFSTAPMYITDSEPSNKKIFQKLGGPDLRNVYRILKATENTSVRLPSTAFTDITANGDGPALKVALPVPSAKGAIIGVWNCRGEGGTAVDGLTKKEINEALSLDGRKKSASGKYVIMYDMDTVHEMEDLAESSDEALSIILPLHLVSGSCKAITVAQLEGYSSFEMAVLGLANKFVGLCAVSEVVEETKKSLDEATPKTNGHHQPAASHIEAEVQQERTEPACDSVPTESTPLLAPRIVPSQQAAQAASANHRTGSRLLALLLFYRRDLSYARSAFFHDFVRSPLKTLFRELRAAFGGPSTLPAASEEAVSDGTQSAATPDAQETIQSEPKTETTEASEPNGTGQHEGDVSVASESSNATAVNDITAKSQVVIRLSVAGKLLLWIPEYKPEAFTVTLQGQEIPEKMITVSGDRVVVDMLTAAQASCEDDTAGNRWEVGVSRN